MNSITNINQFHALQHSTWIYGIIIALIAVSIAWGIASAIPWQGGEDKSYIKRRIWWIIVGIITTFGFFLFNNLYVMNLITQKGWQSEYDDTNIKSTILLLFIYIVVSFIWMLAARHSKFGSILGKKK